MMAGIRDIHSLLALLEPTLGTREWVFVSVTGAAYGDLASLQPLAVMQEQEGLSLIIEKVRAGSAGLEYAATFRRIRLGVHSDLEAVGLTAAVSSALAACGISANLVAACFHDYIFVPSASANHALQALLELQSSA
jgi:hypothetical protein